MAVEPPTPDPVSRVAAYLAPLPAGAASYPECVAKGAMLRRALADRPLSRAHAEALPAAVQQVVACPPLDGEWVPDVHLVCILLAIAHAHGMTDDAYLAWMRGLNARMFQDLFRSAVSGPSPEEIVATVSARWSVFHRGSTLSVDRVGDRWATLRLDFPPWLFHGLALDQFVPVFEAALQLVDPAGAVTCLSRTAAGASFRLTWPGASGRGG